MSTSRSTDWTSIIDCPRALANVEADLFGDWYRDPWSWPELRWLRDKKKFGPVFDRAMGAGSARPVPIDVPKPGFASRPAVLLDPIDRLLYQALVDRISVTLIGDLPTMVYGWRLPPSSPKPGHYARDNFQWENYTGHLTRMSERYNVCLETDVVSCFASISDDELMRRVGESVKGHVCTRLGQLLSDWKGVPGRRGIPQRSRASSVLANFYLRRLDDVLTAHASNGTASVRWMDDIHVFGQTEAPLRRVQVELAACMRDIGIEMNHAKTHVREGDEMRRGIGKVDLAGVDYDLRSAKGPIALRPLLDEIVGNPERAARSRVRFLCKRLRAHKYFREVEKLMSVAHRLPHAADDIGRLLRDSGQWDRQIDWYVDYISNGWCLFDWSLVGFGAMFPSSKSPGDKLIEALKSVLTSRDRGVVAISFASQRLAAWQPEAARHILLRAADRATNPLERRVLAYGALAAGADPKPVREVLGDNLGCSFYREYLEDLKMKAPRVTKDFSGDNEDAEEGGDATA